MPGGFLASVYPANRIFGTAIACSAFLNLFLPGAFEMPGFLILIKVLQGLVEVSFNLLHLPDHIKASKSARSSANHKTIFNSFVIPF